MPIHLHAEPGDYAPVVLLPGDPNRATRIAARFDGGLEASRLVTEHRGLLGYTGTVDGVPVSVQTTMMGTPTTTIVMEELLTLGVTTFIRVGTTGGYGHLGIGDAVVALSAAGFTGVATILGGGEAPRRPPTSTWSSRCAMRRSRRAWSRTSGPIVTTDVFYDPHPIGAVRWARRGYLSAEMESAAIFLLAMRERAKGRPVRAGTILTVSDVIADPDANEGWPPGALVPAAGGRGHQARRPDPGGRAEGRRGARSRLTHAGGGCSAPLTLTRRTRGRARSPRPGRRGPRTRRTRGRSRRPSGAGRPACRRRRGSRRYRTARGGP